MIINTNETKNGNPSILNQNRINEDSEKDAIMTMGIGICQVGCMGGDRAYRFHCARH